MSRLDLKVKDRVKNELNNLPQGDNRFIAFLKLFVDKYNLGRLEDGVYLLKKECCLTDCIVIARKYDSITLYNQNGFEKLLSNRDAELVVSIDGYEIKQIPSSITRIKVPVVKKFINFLTKKETLTAYVDNNLEFNEEHYNEQGLLDYNLLCDDIDLEFQKIFRFDVDKKSVYDDKIKKEDDHKYEEAEETDKKSFVGKVLDPLDSYESDFDALVDIKGRYESFR